MEDLTTIFCWTGGVISPTVPDVTLQWIAERKGQKVDFWTRKAIRESAEDLYVGELAGRPFCQMVKEITGISIDAEDIEAAVLKGLRIRKHVVEVLALLPPIYKIWLISDYPPEWFEIISVQLTPYPFINKERPIFTAEFKLARLVPNIYPLLIRRADQELGSCMLLDGDSFRAVESVKFGLSATIFVDESRLRREFALRKILTLA
jgi:hypothetical protein